MNNSKITSKLKHNCLIKLASMEYYPWRMKTKSKSKYFSLALKKTKKKNRDTYYKKRDAI